MKPKKPMQVVEKTIYTDEGLLTTRVVSTASIRIALGLNKSKPGMFLEKFKVKTYAQYKDGKVSRRKRWVKEADANDFVDSLQEGTVLGRGCFTKGGFKDEAKQKEFKQQELPFNDGPIEDNKSKPQCLDVNMAIEILKKSGLHFTISN